ncbi:hypothetical protein [Streptomyces sp. NBC_00199]|uniref:hypothetical protein n=1 Tax=Streptomyces sp. NBC_00199 TaxID=2975678 RepID=UPI0022564487|nr:hypothetical protein [Streptomyces sp. NBC_00199]MCX5265866.1 hypothetical protein [Streptomyces sp. NBC_00199]
MATTPHAGSSTDICAQMRHDAELGKKELKEERKTLSALKLKLMHETDPHKAQQLREEIDELDNRIKLDEAQLQALLEDISANCSGH